MAVQLTGEQIKTLVTKGLSIADARELAASGIRYEEIAEIADAQAQTLHLAKPGSGDMHSVLAQNAAMMEKVIEKARNRRPESYNGDFPFPNISALNPDGDAAPAQPFKCEFFEGYWYRDEREHRDKTVIEKPGIEHGQLSKLEVRLMNLIQPGEYSVENYDGERGTVRVVATVNEATGAVQQLSILYPKHWVDKASKGRKKPVFVRVLADMLGIESHKASDMVRWLSEREQQTVAA